MHFCNASAHAQASRFKAHINPARLRMCTLEGIRAHASIVSSKPCSPHCLARQLRARQHRFKQALLSSSPCEHASIVSSKPCSPHCLARQLRARQHHFKRKPCSPLCLARQLRARQHHFKRKPCSPHCLARQLRARQHHFKRKPCSPLCLARQLRARKHSEIKYVFLFLSPDVKLDKSGLHLFFSCLNSTSHTRKSITNQQVYSFLSPTRQINTLQA